VRETARKIYSAREDSKREGEGHDREGGTCVGGRGGGRYSEIRRGRVCLCLCVGGTEES